MAAYILSIDQGTTSSRAMVFDSTGKVLGHHQIELTQLIPERGWAEQAPEEVWQVTLNCCRKAIAESSMRPIDITAIGISNQREATVIWDRHSGKPIYNIIGWQDRRTTRYCQTLSSCPGVDEMVSKKTGLLINPYFSASKIRWLLDHVDGAADKARQGQLAFGTIDTYLLWQLTGGKRHLTDASNASRTLLFNIKTQQWDQELLKLFDIPESLLPEVKDNCADFGSTERDIFNHDIAITAMVGDQQAALIGQACFKPGMIKSTYGTGCFLLVNTGEQIVRSQHQLLSTVAYRLDGQVTYALEGSILVAGSAIKWLRDGIHLIKRAADTEGLAASVDNTRGVYMVPAFTGLGAPYWDPKARGALLGITRATSVEHIVRATLEAVCYSTCDLLQTMAADGIKDFNILHVDGGMATNNWLLQFLADMVNLEVTRPHCIETSALGAALLAGLGAGVYQSLDDIAKLWQADRSFSPQMPAQQRTELYRDWQEAVQHVIHNPEKVYQDD